MYNFTNKLIENMTDDYAMIFTKIIVAILNELLLNSNTNEDNIFNLVK